MTNQANFEAASLNLFKQLKEKKEAMQSRHALEVAEVDKEIEAVSTTVRLLRETNEAPIVSAKPATIPVDLHGKSTRLACIEIAKSNNGILRISEAKSALISAGILKKTKNSWAIVYTTLHRSKDFEKGKEAGTFRLITSVASDLQTNLLQ